jgi:hypothetical protein
MVQMQSLNETKISQMLGKDQQTSPPSYSSEPN